MKYKLTEIIALTVDNTATTMQKASVFDGNTPKGVFNASSTASTEYLVRFTPNDPENFDFDAKLFINKFSGNSAAPTDIGYVTLSGSTAKVSPNTSQVFHTSDSSDKTAVIAQVQVVRSNTQITYLEFYVFTDGTDTYSATYEFDTSKTKTFSGDYGNLTADLTADGRIQLRFENTDPNTVLLDAKITEFKSADTGDNPYRFIKNGQPDGTERGLNLLSNRVSASTTDPIIDVITLDAGLFQSARAVVYIDGTELGAIHQVMYANSDGSTFTNVYPFITEGDGAGGSGIGTFGSVINGSDWTLQFYPDSPVGETINLTAYVEAFYRDYDSINYSSTPLTYDNNERDIISSSMLLHWVRDLT